MPHFDKVIETLKTAPVATIAPNVLDSVTSGEVTVLVAPTGSGKSMMVPAMLADRLDEQVIVLVPRRDLATDAATNVAKMAGCELGTDVGYAIGKIAGDGSRYSDKTKLLFVTYGYAISSGLINTAKNIVLDEVHEAEQNISLARAILYARKQQEPELRLMEMSATINARRQAAFWQPAKTAVHALEGHEIPCDVLHKKPGKEGNGIAQTAIDLLQKGRKGILIFRPGVKEIEDTAEELQQLLRANNIRDVEVAQIYRGMPADERRRACLPPAPGHRKILIGTNIIESGMNLRWVDSGITDGMGKIPYDREDTGASALVLEELPQWRIKQQQGRINRDPATTGFERGVFVHCTRKEMQTRPLQGAPELERCSLTSFAFHAAALGYQPEELHLDAQVTPERWQQAHQDLIRLGLVDEDWKLTKDGEYAKRLPVSPETAAVLCEARRMDIAALRSDDNKLKDRPKLLPEAIIIAAIMEQEGLRKNYRKGHGFEGKSDTHGGADLLDGMKAFMQLQYDPAAITVIRAAKEVTADEKTPPNIIAAREKLKEKCAKLNIDYTKFCNAMLLVDEIRARHKDKKSIETEFHSFDADHYNGLKRSILNGSANRLFQLSEDATYRDLLRDYGRRTNDKGEPFSGYAVNPFSTVAHEQQTAKTPFVVGKLREFPGKNGEEPAPIIDQVTSIPAEVLIAWAAGRAEQLPVLDKIDGKTDKDFTARYADAATFTIPLTRPKLETTQQINAMKAVQRWTNRKEPPPSERYL